jgi:hypothetical protein
MNTVVLIDMDKSTTAIAQRPSLGLPTDQPRCRCQRCISATRIRHKSPPSDTICRRGRER